jgi:hypothetical protein
VPRSVPHWADGRIGDAAFDHAAQDEGGIARRATARVVGAIRQHHRATVKGQCLVQRGVDAGVGHVERLAHVDQFIGQTACERLGRGGVAVRVDQHPGAHLGHVAPGESVRDRDRQHAVVAFQCLDAVDEATRRLARRMHRDDHAAVDHRRDRTDLARRLAAHRSTSSIARSSTSCAGTP